MSRPHDIFLFAEHKKMLAEKIFGTNEEVVDETEAYFETKESSNYSNCIKEILGPNDSSPSRVTVLNNKSNFTKKMCFAMLAYLLFRYNICRMLQIDVTEKLDNEKRL